MNGLPSMRALEAVPFEHEGEKMMALLDPARYIETPMVVSIPAFYVLTLMDGRHDVDMIREKFQKRFRQPIARDEVIRLIDQMDSALMLDNERFARHREDVRRRFMESPERLPAFAGASYPDDPRALSEHLDDLLNGAKGADGKDVSAIIVPHIDFRIGADMMASGWRMAAESGADLFIILGIGHSLEGDFFSCVDKDFATPIGPMRVDRPFLARLMENFGEDIYENAEAHRKEHSIEFQSVFMARLFGDRPGVTAVPILLSFPEMVWELDHPVFNGARVDRFIGALKKTAAESRRRTVFVASVDLSHVGARFGDVGRLGEKALEQVRDSDMELIRLIENFDAGGFLRGIRAVNHSNRVCGFPALHTLLNSMEPGGGRLIEYRQNIEGDMETMVSFATMAIS